jgi:hypothetical protein
MRFLLVIALLSWGSALAAEPFVPFTVDESNRKNLQSYLDQQPYMFSAPIIKWLEDMEAQAVKQKQKEGADKGEAAK